MAGIAILCFSYVLSQFYRSFLAVLAPVLGQQLAMTPSQLSYASGAWFMTFALAQFPIGYWLDTHGPRRTVSSLLLLGGGGGIALFALAPTPGWIIFAMGLIGIGCAPVLMAAFYLFSHNFSPARFATLGANFMAIGMAGNVMGSAPMAASVEWLGWRGSALALAAITIATAIALYITVIDPAKNPADAEEKGGYRDLLANRKLWPILPLMLFAYAAPAGIRGVWSGPILEEVYGLGVAGIGTATLYMALGLVVGSFLYGPLDRLFNTRKWLAVAGTAIVIAVLAAFMMAWPQSVLLATTMMVAICIFGSTYVVLMTHGKSFVPKHMTGRGVTLMNFCSIGGVSLMQYFTGFVLAQDTANQGTVGHYQLLFLLYAVTLGLALAIYLFSRDVPPGRAPKTPAQP